jgi:hypothetical protein
MPEFGGIECQDVVGMGRVRGVRFRTMVVGKPDGFGAGARRADAGTQENVKLSGLDVVVLQL